MADVAVRITRGNATVVVYDQAHPLDGFKWEVDVEGVYASGEAFSKEEALYEAGLAAQTLIAELEADSEQVGDVAMALGAIPWVEPLSEEAYQQISKEVANTLVARLRAERRR